MTDEGDLLPYGPSSEPGFVEREEVMADEAAWLRGEMMATNTLPPPDGKAPEDLPQWLRQSVAIDPEMPDTLQCAHCRAHFKPASRLQVLSVTSPLGWCDPCLRLLQEADFQRDVFAAMTCEDEG